MGLLSKASAAVAVTAPGGGCVVADFVVSACFGTHLRACGRCCYGVLVRLFLSLVDTVCMPCLTLVLLCCSHVQQGVLSDRFLRVCQGRAAAGRTDSVCTGGNARRHLGPALQPASEFLQGRCCFSVYKVKVSVCC